MLFDPSIGKWQNINDNDTIQNIEESAKLFGKFFNIDGREIDENWKPNQLDADRVDAARIKFLNLDSSKLDKIINNLSEAIELKEEGLPKDDQAKFLVKAKKVKEALIELKKIVSAKEVAKIEVSQAQVEVRQEEELKEREDVQAPIEAELEKQKSLKREAKKILKTTGAYHSKALEIVELLLAKDHSPEKIYKLQDLRVGYIRKSLKPGRFIITDSLKSHPDFGKREDPYVYFNIYTNTGGKLAVRPIRYGAEGWSIESREEKGKYLDNTRLQDICSELKLKLPGLGAKKSKSDEYIPVPEPDTKTIEKIIQMSMKQAK